ncbi:MAG: heavy-metal-associated domain-containing protein [Lachnospiraceae bacterium]|nr:heavy-metal-associated domain-containing protein [Lachnospiraceae bacterium]
MAEKIVKTLKIEGMMCAHCQAHVQKALEGVAGVTQVEVSLEENKATVTMDAQVEEQLLADAVTEAGYQVVA